MKPLTAHDHLRTENGFLVRSPLAEPNTVKRLVAGLDLVCAHSYEELLARAAAHIPLEEAILLASPSLAATMGGVTRQGVMLKEAQLRRAALAVLKYAIRMETRPTPFGLFAGVSSGQFGTVAKVEESAESVARVVVDSVWLSRVVRRLESDPVITSGVRVRTHQALIRRAGRVCLDYPSALGATSGQQKRVSVSVRATMPVLHALQLADTPIDKQALGARLLSAYPTAGPEGVEALTNGLIASELLVSELQQPLDRSDDLQRLIALLSGASAYSSVAADYLGKLLNLDRARRHFQRPSTPREREGELDKILAIARSIENYETPLHLDVRAAERVTLPDQVAREVESLADVLFRLAPRRLGMRSLRGYHMDFLERFGTDRLVPVLELMDSHRSLGPPADYENPPGGRVSPEEPAPPDIESPERKRVLTRLYAEALRRRASEVVLDEPTLRELSDEEAQRLPRQSSSELYAHVVAASTDTLSNGEFRLVLAHNPGSHLARATSARFVDLLPDLDVAAEEPDSLLRFRADGRVSVDLAYRPVSDRAANLAHTGRAGRKRLSCGVFDSSDAHELRLHDIAIGATLERMYAVHLPTQTEVVPVASNMVSATIQAPNPVRLLFEIGHEGQRLWEPWNWGPVADAPFLPRVRYGRSVLAPATWRPDSLLGALDRDGTDWAAAIDDWRVRWDVPTRVLLVTNDQRLLIDLTSAWHCEIVRDELRRNGEQVFTEVPGDDQGWVDESFKGHLREFVFSITARKPSPVPRYRAVNIPDRPWQATASDWLYLKMYVGHNMDEFICESLPLVVQAARDQGASSCFFIRYTDHDGHHIRLRIETGNGECWGRTATSAMAVVDELQRSGLLSGSAIERWDPEFERYGGVEVHAAVKQVFDTDSAAAAKLLRFSRANGSEVSSLHLLTAVSAASMAHAFGRPSAQSEWANASTEAAATWLSGTGDRAGLPADYRSRPKYWQKLIDPEDDWLGLRSVDGGAEVLELLSSRDEAVRTLSAGVAALEREGRCPTPHMRLIGSLMHMTCNRLTGGEDEAVILGVARGAVQDNARRRKATA